MPDTITPGQLLCVGIYSLDANAIETLKTVHVDANGEVHLYHVGAVKIGGLTFSDAEKTIANAYRTMQFIQDSHASINYISSDPQANRPLAPGDVVSLKIFDLTTKPVERILTLNPAGSIGLPILGQTRLASLTEAQAETAIAQAYERAQMVRNAQVSILRLAPGQTAEPSIEPSPASR